MGHHRFRLVTSRTRQDTWAALTDVEGLARWTGFDRCLGIAGESLTRSATLDCSVTVGDHPVRARVHVLDVTAPDHFALEMVTSLATTTEQVTMSDGPDGGTVVDYVLGATSAAHGPAVRVFVARHLSGVLDGLEDLLGAESTHVAADAS